MVLFYSAILFILAATVTASAYQVELLKFDQFANNSAVPDGYGYVNWTNFYAVDAVGTNNSINPSGYESDVISRNNVLYNNDGIPAAIYSERYAFYLHSAYLAAAWNDNLQVQVNGYYENRLVYSTNYTLSTTHSNLVGFRDVPVTEVDFISSGGTPHGGYTGSGEHFAADNVTIVLSPIQVHPVALHLPTIE